MLSMQVVQLNPGEIQYLTAAASLMIQLPTLILFATAQGWTDLSSPQRLAYYLINGICFHFQTWSGYVLMDAVSPVTHSVANVAKRAILIWVSVMIFKNTITLFSGLGTAIVSQIYWLSKWFDNLQFHLFLGIFRCPNVQQSKTIKKNHRGMERAFPDRIPSPLCLPLLLSPFPLLRSLVFALRRLR